MALPVGLYLVRTQQIFKPKAAVEPGTFQMSANSQPTEYTLNLSQSGNTNLRLSYLASIQGQWVDHIDVKVSRYDPNSGPVGGWSLVTTHQCNPTEFNHETCNGFFDDSYSPTDGGDWIYEEDVYYQVQDADGNVISVDQWCNGEPPGFGSYCGDPAHVIVHATGGNNGGGVGQFTFNTTAFDTCQNNQRTINLSWTNYSGANSYRILRNPNTQGSNTFGTVGVSGPYNAANGTVTDHIINPGTYKYKAEAFTSTDGSGSPIAESNTATIVSPTCSSSGGGTLTVSATQSGTSCDASNHTTVNLSWNSISGAAYYQVLRSNVGVTSVYGTSYSDTQATPGTYTYTIVAVNSSAQPISNGSGNSSPITISCNGNNGGGGPSSCTVNPQSQANVVSGTSIGPFTVSGLGSGVYGCTWNVYPINDSGTAVPSSLPQSCSWPFSFTPTLSNISTSGSFRVVAQAAITSSNTVVCSGATVNVVGASVGGGYGCNTSNQCVPIAGGTMSAGCAGSICATGQLQNCTNTPDCSQATCNVIPGSNLQCGSGSGTQTCLLKGPAPCNPVPQTQPQSCQLNCSSGQSCISGQCTTNNPQTGFSCSNGCISPIVGGTYADASTCSNACNQQQSTTPVNNTPVSVKLANGPDIPLCNGTTIPCTGVLTDETQVCTSALANSNDIRSLNGQTSSIDLSQTLSNGNPGLKLVCAVLLDSNNTPVSSVFWNHIPLVTQTVSPSPTSNNSCVVTQGDANIPGIGRDGRAELNDFNEWRDEFIFESSHGPGSSSRNADFNCDGRVNGIDFTIWSNRFLQTH